MGKKVRLDGVDLVINLEHSLKISNIRKASINQVHYRRHSIIDNESFSVPVQMKALIFSERVMIGDMKDSI